MERFGEKVSFIWSVADLLRGDYKASEYGRVILPLVTLRRLDSVLAPTKDAVVKTHRAHTGGPDSLDAKLSNITGHKGVWNHSPFTIHRLLDAPDELELNLQRYIASFSPTVRDTFDQFGFRTHVERLARTGLLYQVLSRFAAIDLHPDAVANEAMGYLYEELIRRFSEQSNETAGEHFTPREVIRLMVELLFSADAEALSSRGAVVKSLYDPACGTGGMLTVAGDWLGEHNPHARLRTFGQELNPESYATCRSDMLLKGENAGNIHLGNSFTDDALAGETFDYMLANPPFGVEWKKVEDQIKGQHQSLGFRGRFGAGLPRINDGSLLFLQHMVSKMRPDAEGGSRLAIVFNGSPLFTGAAGSGESEIRRWIIENDWLEAVVALPDQLFYNTGISTYFWVVTNRKAPGRQGKVMLVDARASWVKMRKSLGDKRKAISDEQIAEITRLYVDGASDEQRDDERVKVFANEAFGFQRITVERPLRLRWEVTGETIAAVLEARAVTKVDDEARSVLDAALAERTGARLADRAEAAALVADVLAAAGVKGKPLAKAVLDALAVADPDADPVTDAQGRPVPDPDRRDAENVPLPEVPVRFEPDVGDRLASPEYRQAVDAYVTAEVLPFVPDAWVDHSRTKIGYEVPLTRHFYRYVPPRPLAEIDAELKSLEAEIQALLGEVTE
ncbi:class I SAM-dependent DNA methyltransferase [Iamia sp.]|uniref:type I restriction-modification system subunit M n=1 Tax=Iamia sp. TaxID=2722710 RepID=UPI002C3BB53B|nr:class I SAM-dependent DNA methyltransferase [Iamia sp.]HXH57436.1 class I SAM-dependent DNA methyltransferase [Iamia sp.]